jgi:hypothetical protein
MPKIDVNKVAEILKKNQVDPKILRQIVEEMNILTQAEGDDEKPPAVKKQFAILISDPNDRLPKTDFVGWVLQIPEDESVVTTQDRIFRATYEFNATKKGRLMPPKTVGEALENVPAKHFKEVGVWVKTKIPVLMLKSDNEIPSTGKISKKDLE